MAARSCRCSSQSAASVSGRMSGTSPESTSRCLGSGPPDSSSQALSTCMAWPVPRWTSCRTKRDAGWRHRGLHRVRLVADDAVDVLGGDERLCRRDDVQQQGASADLVQHLGPFAIEPRALARGHDDYCETCRFHVSAIFSLLTARRHGFLRRAGISCDWRQQGVSERVAECQAEP